MVCFRGAKSGAFSPIFPRLSICGMVSPLRLAYRFHCAVFLRFSRDALRRFSCVNLSCCWATSPKYDNCPILIHFACSGKQKLETTKQQPIMARWMLDDFLLCCVVHCEFLLAFMAGLVSSAGVVSSSEFVAFTLPFAQSTFRVINHGLLLHTKGASPKACWTHFFNFEIQSIILRITVAIRCHHKQTQVIFDKRLFGR